MSREPDLEHPERENARPPAETWRVLFLDCEEHIDRLKAACREAGYVVVGATTIADAWQFLHGRNHADVIVCAAHLEDESMLEFLQAVRVSEHHRDTVFVILSLEPNAAAAQLDRSTRQAGMLLGADAYLEMPRFDPEELIAQIRHLQPAVPTLQSAKDDDAADQILEEARRVEQK
jgi:CheY-like chemotaxis protein